MLRAVASTKGTVEDLLWEVQFLKKVQSSGENQQQKAVEYQDLIEALGVA